MTLGLLGLVVFGGFIVVALCDCRRLVLRQTNRKVVTRLLSNLVRVSGVPPGERSR
jgi:hypothetical protein